VENNGNFRPWNPLFVHAKSDAAKYNKDPEVNEILAGTNFYHAV